MYKDNNFISQLKISLDKNLPQNINYILEGSGDCFGLSNQDFYIVCYAYNFIKNYKKSNLLIQSRKKNLENLILKKKFLRLEIFNHFYLQNSTKVQALAKSNLKISFDTEVVKVFYLSLKSVGDYADFLISIVQSIKDNHIIDKDISSLLSFFIAHNELRIHAILLLKIFKKNKSDKAIIKNLAINYFQLKKYHLAKKYYEKLIKNNSTNELLLELALINNILRKKDDSENCIKLALYNNPNDLKALYYKRELDNSKINNQVLIDAFLNVEKNNISQCSLSKDLFYFYFSNIYEKNFDYKKSFIYMQKGNDIRNQDVKYDIKNVIKEFNFFLDNFSNKNIVADAKLQFKNLNKKANTPIFIIGLPRSGTTLVEHILGSHSQVKHFGERNYFFKNFKFLFDVFNLDNNKKIFDNLKIANYLEYGDFYRSNFSLPAGKTFFTDKMPFNFLYIGLIKYALPDVKIILCKRDYRDIGLSLYKNFFAEDVNFAYDKKNIIQYISQFHKTINSWTDIFGDEIFQIDYNHLVADPKSMVSKMLNYCNLPWEDSCLEFHKKKLSADTVSVMQVTSPIYDKSVGSWKHYYEFLKDFFDELERIK